MMKKKKTNIREMPFQIGMIILFSLMFIICIYPFYYIFIVSISSPELVQKNTVTLYPLGFTLSNYKQIFELSGILQSFFVSVARTVAGTAVTLFFTSILAYTLTKDKLPLRKFFYRFAVISMYVNAGIIPWYLTMRNLGLKDNFLVYILPTAVSGYCLILIKTYMEQISTALEESAMLDGAGYFTIFIRIVLPVSMPILAAVTVFTAVGQWNQWMDNLLLVNDKSLRTLQLVLLEYLNQANAIALEAKNSTVSMTGVAITPFTIRMTITMVVTLPILMVYPFMQKYFIKGIMVGAVKG